MNTRTVGLLATATTMTVGFATIATVVPVVQSAQGLSPRAIAWAGAASSVGTVACAFILGTRPRVSRRSLQGPLLVLLLTGLGLSALVLRGITISPLLRVADGFALGAAIVACETVLLLVVRPDERARALALYALATAGGWVLGPLLAAAVMVDRQPGSQALGLGVAAIASVVAMLLSTLVREPDDQPASADDGHGATTTTTTATIQTLWRDNLVPCLTTGHFGAFQNALLVLLPLHLLQGGVEDDGVLQVLAAFALGMLLFTLPNARLGERMAPTRLLALLCAGGGMALLLFASVPASVDSVATMARLGLTFIVGATLATLSPLSLMLQVQLNTPAALPRANALYNAHYAVGLLVGPLLVAAAIEVAGTTALLRVSGALWLLHALFILGASSTPRLTSLHRSPP